MVVTLHLSLAEVESVSQGLAWQPVRQAADLVGRGTPSAVPASNVYLGVAGGPASTPTGLLLTDVASRSPAAEAGLRTGDVILTVGGGAVRHQADVVRRLD